MHDVFVVIVGSRVFGPALVDGVDNFSNAL